MENNFDPEKMLERGYAILNEDYDEALNCFRKAADAGNVEAMIELMRHYEANEFYEDAAKMAERIVEIADAYRAENNLDKAIELYEEVAALDFTIGVVRLEEMNALEEI